MKELVEYIARSLVDEPEEVRVYEADGYRSKVIELSVAQPDMGRIIGKRGRVINSIRAVTQAAAARQGERISVEVVED